MYDLGVVGGLLYLRGSFVNQNLYLLNGRISLITSEVLPAKQTVDAVGLKVLPGLIDPHVHLALNVGDYTSCDDFVAGGSAAAEGGITTVLDFLAPISHEKDLHEALHKRLKEAAHCPVDYGFHVTLMHFEGSVSSLVEMAHHLSMSSVKVFTTYSESNRMIQSDVLKQLLEENILVMVHAEDDAMVDAKWSEIATYGSSRPLASELSAIDQLLSLRSACSRLYVVHVSSGSGVKCLMGHEGVFIESCPQYFYFNETVFEREDGALYLLAPPFRSEAERLELNKHFDGLTSIGTDHCPFTEAQKHSETEAFKIPKGVGGLKYSFLLMHNLFGDKVIDKMSKNVAECFHLKYKGSLEVGFDGDFVLFNPGSETVIDASIYKGMRLKGAIEATYVRGHEVFSNGEMKGFIGRYVRGD